jgi:hypothetical protein
MAAKAFPIVPCRVHLLGAYRVDQPHVVPSVLMLVLLQLLPELTYAQCAEPHYRWSEKIDGSLANITAVKVSVPTILRRWTLPEFTSRAKYKCAARQGRELKVYLTKVVALCLACALRT